MIKGFSSQIFLGALILGAYCFLSIFALMPLSSAHHGNHHTAPCPFMVGHQALCSMGTFDHIAAWQSFSQSTSSSQAPIVILAIVVTVFLGVFHTRATSPPRRFFLPGYPSLFEQLFANGILHPKAP